MKARPILFSSPMVRALIEGRKTQTRRVVKGAQPKGIGAFHIDTGFKGGHPTLVETTPCLGGTARQIHWSQRMPYGVPGDLLWVRESWCEADEPGGAAFMADHPVGADPRGLGWRPSIHMPRWASRLTLRIKEVRVERLQDISEGDAKAEGVLEHLTECGDGVERNLWFGIPQCGHENDPVQAYADLWDSISNPRGLCADDAPLSWGANPWVWAVSFEVIPQNIDSVLAKEAS